MSTKNHRTLVTIQCQSLPNAEKLDADKFGVQIKSEYRSGNSEMRSNSRMNSELCDLPMKSEYPNSLINDDNPRKSPRPMAALVKQEISIENLKTEPVEIKCEYNVSSHASSAEQTILKTEKKYVKPSNSNTKIKMQERKWKMESNDVKMIYRCCSRTFSDKFRHFDHMLSHSEYGSWYSEHHGGKKKKRSRQQNKQIQCYYCPRVFNKESDMIRHSKATHTGFYCIYCPFNFPKKRVLLDHLAVAHNVTLTSNDSYCRPGHMIWKRQTISQTAVKKSLENIKAEGSIKVEPEMGDVKTEFQPITIKAEPHKTEPAY